MVAGPSHSKGDGSFRRHANGRIGDRPPIGRNHTRTGAGISALVGAYDRFLVAELLVRISRTTHQHVRRNPPSPHKRPT